MAFDKEVVRYAYKCASSGLVGRAEAAVRMLRTRKFLEEFRKTVAKLNNNQISDLCTHLYAETYGDDDTKTALDESVLNMNLFQLGSASSTALYKRRIDDQGFAFMSGNARERFKHLEAAVRLNVDDYLS